jgi:hypothetical protein
MTDTIETTEEPPEEPASAEATEEEDEFLAQVVITVSFADELPEELMQKVEERLVLLLTTHQKDLDRTITTALRGAGPTPFTINVQRSADVPHFVTA